MTASDGSLSRIPTGVPGLDTVLRGGVFAGAVYIVRGTPGAGKTILANQICFHHAANGGRALFVTLLAESHARMLQNMERLSFYDASAIPKHIYYVSAFRTLEEEGLKGLMGLLRREMRAHQATIAVLDGLLAVEETSTSDREFRKFIHEFQAHAAASDCAAFLLTNGSRAEYHPEHTMVDGLITLDDMPSGKRKLRELEVKKFRGSGGLRGRHAFRITDDGVTLYPRLESASFVPGGEMATGRLSTGIPALDTMMGGGPLIGSTSLALGASGAGKTTLGMHFLSCSSATEPGLHFGFYETPQRLMTNAASIGLDMRALVQAGHLEMLWYAPTEQILDDLGGILIAAVKRRAVRRLFVDGLDGFFTTADTARRIAPFFAALANELSCLGVTTLYGGETENLIGPQVNVPFEGISVLSENMILLRFAEFRGKIRRLISIMKVRGSAFDPTLREFEVTGHGMEIAGSIESAEAIMSGFGLERGHAPPFLGGGSRD